jgi:hypothetical protein
MSKLRWITFFAPTCLLSGRQCGLVSLERLGDDSRLENFAEQPESIETGVPRRRSGRATITHTVRNSF